MKSTVTANRYGAVSGVSIACRHGDGGQKGSQRFSVGEIMLSLIIKSKSDTAYHTRCYQIVHARTTVSYIYDI